MTQPKVLAIIQARMSSTRLPGKVLKPINGRAMLARQLDRMAGSRLVDKIVIATSVEASDDPLVALCASENIACYRGPLADVLGRFIGAARAFGPPDHVARLTGDCPLTDPQIVDACIALHLANGVDYTSNSVERTYPDGLDVEVMRFDALANAARDATEPFEREHVTPRLYRRTDLYSQQALRYIEDLAELRWTVDNPRDFDFAERVFAELLPVNPLFGWREVLALLAHKPEIAALNS